MNPALQSMIDSINEEIDHYEFGNNPPELYDPIRYILALGGKRMRPLLVLLASQLKEENWQDYLKPAVAVEVFHNFTLMHDDIMDDAPIRRGKATVHEKWNPNIAILSGDAMLVKAYDLLLTVDPELLPEVLKLFNTCAVEVCEGQQLDMNFESRDQVSVEEYIDMIRLKTAVLLGFSLEMGALLGGVDRTNARLLRDFGINIGIGFQLKDDLLDVFGDQKKFGKQVGGDIIANKKTFLLIHALENAEGEMAEKLEYWLNLQSFDKAKKVEAVTEIYEKLDIPGITQSKIESYFDKGFQALSAVDLDTPGKKQLEAFAKSLINREQ